MGYGLSAGISVRAALKARRRASGPGVVFNPMDERDVVTQNQHRRRRQPRRENPVFRFLSSYPEVIMLVVLGVGAVLLLGDSSVHKGISSKIGSVLAQIAHTFVGLADALEAFVSHLTMSDVVGWVLVIAATVAILASLRRRLLHTPSLTDQHCPKCGATIHRVHRNFLDRLINWIVPVRRYGCSNADCRWVGLRVGTV
jgi:hypothetical protein